MDIRPFYVALSNGSTCLITKIHPAKVPDEVEAILAVPSSEIRQAFPDEAGYWLIALGTCRPWLVIRHLAHSKIVDLTGEHEAAEAEEHDRKRTERLVSLVVSSKIPDEVA